MKHKAIVCFIGLFVLLLGVAQLLVLPPFEGFDEKGHYSLIRQIAALGYYPDIKDIKIDKATETYRQSAPYPYAVFAPYEANEGITYRDFFDKPDKIETFRRLYRDQPFTTPFEAADTANWQRQHPPLYYILLSFVQKAVEGRPYLEQFFAMRFVSFGLALTGFLIGLWGTLRYLDPRFHKNILYAFALYPLLFLQFVPEFARLGNDSLCLLLLGVLWTLVLRHLQNEHDVKGNLLIGCVLGLGLLTKGFFLPVTAGVGAYMLVRLWSGRHDRALSSRRFDDMIYMATPLVFCGFWYIYQWKTTGVFLGHYEYANVAENGGLWTNVRQYLSLKSGLLGLFGLFFTTTWAGTASLCRYNDFIHYPYLFFVFWMVASAYRNIVLSPVALQPVRVVNWILFFFAVGIIHHMFVVIGLGDIGGTPGWYLHIMTPALAYLLAFAFAEIEGSKLSRFLFGGMMLYTLYFLVSVAWAGLAVTAGCSFPLKNKYLAFADSAYCLTKIPQVIDNVAVVGWPHAAGVAVVLAFVFLILALIRIRKLQQPPKAA